MGDGGLNKNWGPNQEVGIVPSFSTIAGGGLDTPITRRIAFRMSGGFEYAYFSLGGPHIRNPYRPSGLPTNFCRISSGVVWQF